MSDDNTRAGHRILIDRKHNHSVIAQQALFDGVREGELIGNGAILLLVVHGVELCRHFAGASLHIVAIDLGRCRHEKALISTNALSIHNDLIAGDIIVFCILGARSTMRFIAHAQPEAG